MREKELAAAESLQLLEAVPGIHLFLYPDAPLYPVAGMSAAFEGCFQVHRNELIGQPAGEVLLQLFPHKPSMEVLIKSMDFVHQYKKAHHISTEQPYHPVSPGGQPGQAVKITHHPILDDQGSLHFILQQVDLTGSSVNDGERQQILLDKILQFSSCGISVTEVIRNEEGKIVDGRTLLANDSAVRFTGIPRELYLTKTALELDPGIIHSPYYQMVIRALETGIPFHTQYYIEPTNQWLELSVSKMDDDHLVNIFTDVTPTKQVQLDLEKAAERLSAVFNAAQSGMFTFSPIWNESGELVDFRFVIVNTTMASYVQQSPAQMEGKPGSVFFPGYLHNGVFDMYRKTYLTGETQRQNFHYNTDGLDIYLDLMSTKVGDEVLVTFTDYTPLHKAQIQLESYVEELKRSNSNLEEFAHAASHDLKEPIRKVHFFSSRLKASLADRMTEEEKKFFDRMENAAARMSLLVDDLLEYSHVSFHPQEMEWIDLNAKLKLVLEDLELAIEEKKAKIHVGPMPKIKGHRRQIQQLFQNLIGNALKYNKPGSIPEISISANRVRGYELDITLNPGEESKAFYLIEVRDQGIGFEQEDSERIFQVFQRLHGNAEYRGTGIGLSIARKVVNNHHGKIWAESEPGKGASFKILLPAEEPQNPQT